MNYTDIKPNQTEEENILICDVSDEALETAADTERENAEDYMVLLPHRTDHLPSLTTH